MAEKMKRHPRDPAWPLPLGASSWSYRQAVLVLTGLFNEHEAEALSGAQQGTETNQKEEISNK